MASHAAAALLFAAQPVVAEQTPLPPPVPTFDSCKQFSSAIHQALMATHRRVASCMRAPPRFGHINTCRSSHRPPYLADELVAWSQCGDEEPLRCELYSLQDTQVPACFAAAKASAQLQERLVLEAKELEAHAEKFQQARDAWNNPKRFFMEQLESRIPEEMNIRLQLFGEANPAKGVQVRPTLNSPITLHPFERNFTGRGVTLMQETYDYLFGATAGNERLYSGNPIIQAIQGAAANELRNIHGYTLQQLEQMADDFAQFTIPTNSTTPSSRPSLRPTPPPRRSRPQPASADCALLDGPERTRVSTEEPEFFEALVERCGGGSR